MSAENAFRIDVDASPETGGPYPVLLRQGILGSLPAVVQQSVAAHRWAVVADHTVARLHGERLLDAMREAGLETQLFAFPPGEAQKTRATWAVLTDELLERGYGRDSAVVTLGGGVVGDLGGFLAATFLRGVPCVQIPTTLLAMIDAAIGGKTGIDVPAGKNLVGVIRQPRLVLVDPDVLATLPDVEFRNGLAEAVKHGAIADASYLDWMVEQRQAILARDADAVAGLIRRSIEIKAGMVAADAAEAGPRALLNFGHTIAHAIERVSGFVVPHGQAVAMGMVVEARIGEMIGVTRGGTADRLCAALEAFGLPTTLPGRYGETGDLLEATRSDKKVRASRVRYALIAESGRPARSADGDWTIAVADADVLRAAKLGSTTISRDETDI